MSTTRRITVIAGAAASALLALTSIGAAAQEEAQPANLAEINAGLVSGVVTMDGAALVAKGDEEYYFSDGTEMTAIDIDTGSADPDVPLFTLINIVGTVASHEIDVTSWSTLDIMAPAVIRSPEEVNDIFKGWIVAQNSMAPIETMSENE